MGQCATGNDRSIKKAYHIRRRSRQQQVKDSHYSDIMSYNKKYLLQRIVEIQNIVLREKERGFSQAWIYRHLISEKYHISEATFNRYLGINAKEQQRQLQEKGEF